jgi:hypothetical protein
MLRSTIFFVALLSWVLVNQHDATAETCGCKYQKASSESNTGTCAVREDMAARCLLVWGGLSSPGGVRDSSIRPNERAVLDSIVRAASAFPDGTGAGPRGPLEVQKPEFWSTFEHELRSRSRLGTEESNFDRSLGLLSDQKAAFESRQLTTAALTYASAALLAGAEMDPTAKQALLSSMIRHQEWSLSFLDSKPQAFKDIGKLSNGQDFTIEGFAAAGCIDVTANEIKSGLLIKTQWARPGSLRC